MDEDEDENENEDGGAACVGQAAEETEVVPIRLPVAMDM